MEPFPHPAQPPQPTYLGAKDALLFFAEQEATYRTQNVHEPINSPRSLQRKEDYYRSVYLKYRNSKDKNDRALLPFIRSEIRQTYAKLHPTTYNKIVYHPIVQALRQLIISQYRKFQALKVEIYDTTAAHSKKENVNSILEELQNRGFKLDMKDPIQRMLQHNLPEFTLRYYDMQHKDADFLLYFKKYPGTDTYYLAQFDATRHATQKEKYDANYSPNTLKHGISDNFVLTASEAANLANGRPLLKNTDGIDNWLRFDKNGTIQQTDFINFDLKAHLSQYPLIEAKDAQKMAKIEDGLRQGDTMQTEINIQGTVQKVSISINNSLSGLLVTDKFGQTQFPSQFQEKNLQRHQVQNLSTRQEQQPSNGTRVRR